MKLGDIPIRIGPPGKGCHAIDTITAVGRNAFLQEAVDDAHAKLIEKAKEIKGCIAIHDFRIAPASRPGVTAYFVIAYGTAVAHDH